MQLSCHFLVVLSSSESEDGGSSHVPGVSSKRGPELGGGASKKALIREPSPAERISDSEEEQILQEYKNTRTRAKLKSAPRAANVFVFLMLQMAMKFNRASALTFWCGHEALEDFSGGDRRRVTDKQSCSLFHLSYCPRLPVFGASSSSRRLNSVSYLPLMRNL